MKSVVKETINCYRLLSRLLLCCCTLLASIGFAGMAQATCSAYMGHASINEISKEHNWKLNFGDFVEVKLLDNDLSSTIYNGWTLTLCENTSDPECTTLNLSSFSKNTAYLTKAGSATWGYVNWTSAFDVLLKDGSGNTIDYVSVNGHSEQNPACTTPYDTSATTGSSTRRIRRLPDGTGDWNVPSGNSEPASEGTGNTPIPAGSATLSISDATAAQGNDMVFNISLIGNSSSVVITYSTFNGTAIAGTDYTTKTGSITVPSGTTSATITVPTLSSGASSSQTFFLLLDSVTNAFAPDQVAIGHITVPVVSVDHYRIEYDGAALTCAVEPVTIKACANSDCSTLYASSTTVTFTAAIPTPASVSSDITFTGSALIDVAESTATTITLSLPATSPTATVKCYQNTVLDASCDYDVTDTGFIFYNETDNNQLVPTQLSDKPSDTGFNAKIFSLQAVQLDTTTGACAPLFVDGSDVAIEMAYQCESPASCSGNPVTLINNGNSLILGKYSTYTSNNLRFANDSKATITFKYPEAGQIKLHVRLSVELLPGETKVITGSTNSFVVRPFGLGLDLNGAANATAIDETGSAFVRAGEAFTVNASPVRWVSGEDSNNDGIPDNYASINDNGIAANVSDEVLKLSHAVEQPVAAAIGTLSGSTASQAFTNSVATATDIAWDEVGIITLNAQLNDADYLGTGNLAGQLTNIGRFVPDHFTLLGSDLLDGCNTFTYMDQTFNLTLNLEARNSADVVTSNYKNNHDNATLTFVAENALVAADDEDLSARLTVADPNWADGVINVALAASLARVADTTADAVTVGIRLDDGEPDLVIALSNTLNMDATNPNACAPNCDALKLHANAKVFRYGRLNSNGSYGPIIHALQLPLFTEYYNGTTYVLASDDSCSTISANEVNLAGISSAPFGSYNIEAIDSATVVGSTTVDLSDASTTANQLSAVTGEFNLTLAVPTLLSEVFSADINMSVDLTNYPWLQFDWDGDGNDDAALPDKLGTYGQSRGNDRVIYWREKH